MASPKERLEALRGRRPLLDHLLRTQEHYGEVKGSQQAGAVTYFGFLSFFPILALAFAAVGLIAGAYPDASDALVDAIDQVFPGMIGPDSGQITLTSIQNAAATVGIIGVVTLVYSGLGWLSGMRTALQVVFELPRNRRPNFLIGKLRDLVTLVVVGLTLLISVAVSGVITHFSDRVLDLADLDHDMSWSLEAVAVVIALVASTVFFFVLFTVLARPRTPDRSLWQGALLGALAFEILKQLSGVLLAATHRSPAFQAFGIALILLVWINYFSRIVMYAASWAYTSAPARAAREQDQEQEQDQTPALPASYATPDPVVARVGHRLDPRLAFGAGAAAALGLVALLRRRGD